MRERQRGVALITVILILLVLTVLGIAAALLMTQEDRTSARQELYKAALYSAEVGLRNGEAILNATPTAALSALLTFIPDTGAFPELWRDPPRTPGLPRFPPCGPPQNWNTTNLGTYLSQGGVGNTEQADIEVPIAVVGGSLGTGKRAFYSLYIRNNPEDAAVCGGGAGDTDGVLRLVSVGWITNQDGSPLAVKILEEEFNVAGVSQAPSAQKQVNQGGTGQGIL
ncbi:MAG: PilX N-terminal domain-containing pilus assembly protein [Acidobacteriota bacterium]